MKSTIHKLSILLIGMLCLSTSLVAQDWNLVMELTVTNDGKRMDGAVVELRKGGSLVKSFKTDSRGDVDVPLDPNGNYEISISGNGMIKKKIAVNTQGVPPEDLKGEYYFPAEVDIFPKLEGLDYKVLDQPIGKIGYVAKNQSFDADLDYTKQRKAALDKLQADYLDQKEREAELAAQKQKEYDAAIKAADKAFSQEQWELAEKEYKKAAELKPIETYPSFQLAELETKLIKLREAAKNYDEAIRLADQAADAKDYQRAVTEYKRAANTKPDEDYPQEKIKEMQGLLAQQVKSEQAYLAAIEKGDNALKISDLNLAKEAFEAAQLAKPEEAYPKNKLAEINDILGKREAKEQEYQTAVKAGDEALAAKKYEEAKASYQKALTVKPTESYPQEQISKVDALIVESAKEQQEYLAAVERADQALSGNQLEVALAAYKEAGGIKPAEEYPKNKVKEVESLIAKQAEQDKAYKDKIAEADKAFGSESYEIAKTTYEAAASLKPKETYPQTKLQEIEGILASKAQADAEYQAAIQAGDQALAAENYPLAKEKYNAAQSIKPEEGYPKEKLAEIGAIMVKIEENQAAYDKAIQNADDALADKNLDKAEQYFNEAKGLMPEQSYPQEKLSEIAGIRKDRAAAEQAYQEAIATADAALESKDLQGALAAYQKASGMKPEESYPKDQIAKVEGILAEAAKEEADYQAAIKRGDEAFSANNLETAIAAFEEAKGIKANESYPAEKISEIEEILAANKAKEQEYQTAITKADAAFKAENYAEAKQSYEAAINLKEEQYPKDQIAAVDEKLAAIAAEKAAVEKLKVEYEKFILEGQQKLDAEEYETALAAYKKAAELKPDETLPQERITEIETTLAEIKAKQEAEARRAELRAKYDAKIAEADQAYEKEDYKGARQLYQESLTLIASEAHPQGRIEEINKLLADAAEQEKAYDEAIAAGEALIKEEEWKSAKSKFELAKSIKSDEPLVQQKIDEIDARLAEIAAEAAAIKLANQKQAEIDAQYEALLSEADALAENSKWKAAKAKYEAALELKTEQLPKDKIAEMNTRIEEENARLAAEEANKVDAEYNALIAEADAFFADNKLEEARLKYKAALEVKDEQYPKDQLLAVADKEKQLDTAAEQAKRDAEFQLVLAEADALFEEEKVEKAGAKYREALKIKEDQYARDQLKLIDARIAELAEAQEAKAAQAEVDAQYNELITKADQAFENKDYQNAKSKYEEAVALKENDPYPANQLKEIERLSKALSAEKQYEAAISKADKSLEYKDYENAKAQYQEALAIKANENYPQEQIIKIEELIAAEQAKVEEFKLQQAKQDADYQAALAAADQAFENQDYGDAKAQYQVALSIKSKETYPQSQIDMIDQLMAEQDKAEEIKLQEEREVQEEAEYQAAISEADKFYSDKEYQAALEKYQIAKSIRPNKTYPIEQIDKINELFKSAELAAAKKEKEAKERERRYLEIISSGNAAFKEEDYEMAIRQYQAALAMKPDEAYPQNKIKEIRSILKGTEEKEPEKKAEPIAIQTGPKSSVDGSAEDEIDRMYAERWAKKEAEKGTNVKERKELLEAMREDDREREEAKQQNAIQRIEDISISMRDQQQNTDELNLQNYETVKRNTKEHNEKVQELSKEAERRRNNNLVDNEARMEANLEFQKEKNEEVSTIKRVDLERKEQDQVDFRKEHTKDQTQRIYQEGDNALLKEEAIRNYNSARLEENSKKNTADIEQRQSDYFEGVQKDRADQDNRTTLEKDKVVVLQEKLKTYNEERADDYMDGYEKVKQDIKSKDEFENSKRSDSEKRRQEEQSDLEGIAEDLRSQQAEGNNHANENYIGVVEKTEALEITRKQEQSESEKRRQEALGKEYYEGEEKPREDPEAANYSQGVTEKVIENSNGSTTIRRIKVEGTQVDIYEKTLFSYGKIHYSKNGSPITKEMWDSNSK